MVTKLHEEVGFSNSKNIFLFKRVENNVVYHDFVDANKTNVKYSCKQMVFEKDNFYSKYSNLKLIN